MTTSKRICVFALPAMMGILGATISLLLLRYQRVSDAALQLQLYDFGERLVGETVTHTFEIENPDSYPLHIKVKPHCSCTLLETVPEVIEPKTRCTIPVEVNLKTEGDNVGARVLVHIEGRKPLTLLVKGRVIRQCPDVVSFGEVLRGRNVEKTFVIKQLADEEELSIIRIEQEKDYYDIECVREPERGDVWVTVSLKTDNMRWGYFKDQIRFLTNTQRVPVKKITMEGYVVGAIEIKPSIISYGVIDLQRPEIVKELMLHAPYGDSIIIDQVGVTPDDVLACSLNEVVRGENAARIPVRLHVSAIKTKVFKGNVTVYAHTDKDPIMKRFDVEVYALTAR